MEIYFEKQNKTITIELKEPTILKELLKKHLISNSSVILVKNNSICLENTIVTNSDNIKILSVVSGG